MKILVKLADVQVSIDDFEKGETDFVNSWVLDSLTGKRFDTVQELVEEINKDFPIFSNNIDDYIFIDGRIDTDAFVNADNDEPTPCEIEAWKVGKITLYNAHLFINLAIVPDEYEREFTEADAEKYGVSIY